MMNKFRPVFLLPRLLSTASSSSSPSPYHALFKLPATPNPYVIDLSALKKSYLQAQRLAHPDAWSGKGQDENQNAAEQSAHINKAYHTLLSPLKRAEYLLSLQGYEVGEADKLEGSSSPEQQSFIMEVMEAREELEDAESEEDIIQVRLKNKERIDQETQTIQDAFGVADYQTALKCSIRLRYWEGIETAAKERS